MPGSQQTTVKCGNLNYPSVPSFCLPGPSPGFTPLVILSSPVCDLKHDWEAQTESAGGLPGH